MELQRWRRETRDAGLARRCQIILHAAKRRSSRTIAEAARVFALVRLARHLALPLRWAGWPAGSARRQRTDQADRGIPGALAAGSGRKSPRLRLPPADMDARTSGAGDRRPDRNAGAGRGDEPGAEGHWQPARAPASGFAQRSDAQLPMPDDRSPDGASAALHRSPRKGPKGSHLRPCRLTYNCGAESHRVI